LSPHTGTAHKLLHASRFVAAGSYLGDATGGVFANLYPAKAETPYRSMGCATAAIFIALAIIPVGFIAVGLIVSRTTSFPTWTLSTIAPKSLWKRA
jgi:hypothetical protein